MVFFLNFRDYLNFPNFGNFRKFRIIWIFLILKMFQNSPICKIFMSTKLGFSNKSGEKQQIGYMKDFIHSICSSIAFNVGIFKTGNFWNYLRMFKILKISNRNSAEKIIVFPYYSKVYINYILINIKYMVNFMSEDEIRVERGHFDDRCGALLCTSADGLGPKHAHFRIIQ